MKKPMVLLLLALILLCGTAYGAETTSYSVTFLENQTTGYTWFYTISDAAVLTVDDQGFLPEDAEGMAGVGGTHTWTVTGAGAGEASLNFYYAWAWAEEFTEPDVTYTFASDGTGRLTLLSTDGLPERYMPGKVAVRLKENPTTGYQWSEETDVDGILSLTEDVYEQVPASEDVMGAGGVHTWFFDAKAEGAVILTFRYARSFEADETPAAKLMLTYLVDAQLDAVLIGLDGDYEYYLTDMP